MGRPHQETGHRQCAPPPTYADLARNWAASYSSFRQITDDVDFAISLYVYSTGSQLFNYVYCLNTPPVPNHILINEHGVVSVSQSRKE